MKQEPLEDDLKWYAVYTRHKFEKKIAGKISELNIEIYCPLVTIESQWSDRKKKIKTPLFNSYLFVRFDIKDQLKIREIAGVVNFVYWLGKPAVIQDKEIKIIKMFLNEYENIKVEKVAVNDQVRILSGPLLFHQGEVSEVKNSTVKVYLPSLGFEIYAEVSKASIEVIKRNIAS